MCLSILNCYSPLGVVWLDYWTRRTNIRLESPTYAARKRTPVTPTDTMAPYLEYEGEDKIESRDDFLAADALHMLKIVQDLISAYLEKGKADKSSRCRCRCQDASSFTPEGRVSSESGPGSGSQSGSETGEEVKGRDGAEMGGGQGLGMGIANGDGSGGGDGIERLSLREGFWESRKSISRVCEVEVPPVDEEEEEEKEVSVINGDDDDDDKPTVDTDIEFKVETPEDDSETAINISKADRALSGYRYER